MASLSLYQSVHILLLSLQDYVIAAEASIQKHFPLPSKLDKQEAYKVLKKDQYSIRLLQKDQVMFATFNTNLSVLSAAGMCLQAACWRGCGISLVGDQEELCVQLTYKVEFFNPPEQPCERRNIHHIQSVLGHWEPNGTDI